MKNKIGKLIFVSFLLTTTCSSYIRSSASATAPGIMEAKVLWLKDKSRVGKFDFALSLTNESDKGVIIFLTDIACSKGGVNGDIKHTFYNTGERTIDFKPGQTKKFNLVCRLPQLTDNNQFIVKIKRISEDLNNDGRDAGKVLYNDLSMTINL